MCADAINAGSAAGFVSLVGAGPGDPGLLTLRGAAALERADVVVYDALANPQLLAHAPQSAERIYVGKQAATHAMTQDEITALLVKLGQAGKRVVRLKGGDPFVFGRGGEECLALAQAGVAFDVVPGVTAAIGAPAYAGIPVTHRDFNSSFTFITGHEKEDEYKDDAAKARGSAVGSSDIDWATIAKLPCIAFYMGVKSLPRICAKLIEHGLPADTPGATIYRGTTPQQRTVTATVATLAEAVAAAKIGPPAVTIIGRVVSLRDSINWFEHRPLFGKTIVVTRTRQQASELTSRLESLGATVIEAPTIEITRAADMTAIDEQLKHLWMWSEYGEFRHAEKTTWPNQLGTRTDCVIFTSANGVRMTRDRMDALGFDGRIFAATDVAVVGTETATVCRELLGVTPDFVPDRQTGEALAETISAADSVRGNRFVVLRADIASPLMVEALKKSGAAEVIDLPIYETRPPAALPAELTAALAEKRVHAITFTSSSTATNFAKLAGENYRDLLTGVQIVSIGPVTGQTLRDLGIPPTVEATQYDIAGLVAALVPSPSGRRLG